MPQHRQVEAGELRAALAVIEPWLAGTAAQPVRGELAQAVRLSLRTLAQLAPGAMVEVRVPPFAAVQCVAGPWHARGHTRGIPPNVVETDPRTWLELATGRLDWAVALTEGRLVASGTRADVSRWLPLVRDPGSGSHPTR